MSSKPALMKKQIGGRNGKTHHGQRCNKSHKSVSTCDNLQFFCEGGKNIVFLPQNKETGDVPKMKFKNIYGLSKCHFVGYADSESSLRPTYISRGETKLIQEHNASCWGCIFNTSGKSEYFDCYSENPTREFSVELIRRAISIFEKYWEARVITSLANYSYADIPMDEIINDESIDFSCRYFLKEREMTRETKIIGEREKWKVSKCLDSNEAFVDGEPRVIDHDHITGKYFGIAHKNCNVQRKSRAEMIIFLHNASYDFVELIPGLLDAQKYFPEIKIKVKGIPKTGEKFICFLLEISVAKEI